MHRIAGADESAAAAFDVVALVTSAGGLDAMRSVLRELPADFPAAVVVAQHLGGQGSALVEILSRHSNLPVAWATPGDALTQGRVFVSPPRRLLEILPDRTCAIGEARVSAQDRPLDLLLQSIAETYGPRALGVVLTGMGRDASAGAASVKRAGGIVFAQSEDTAEQPSMPRTAVEAGAVDLVLPLHEIGRVITDVVRGGALPRSRAEIDAASALFAGDGEVRQLLRTLDWSRTALGPIAEWPSSLRTTLHLVLESPLPMCLLWGDGLIQLYNDEYRLLMRDKHPAALGHSSRESWPEVWHLNEPIFRRVRGGESVALRDALYPIVRRGTIEDAWFDLSFTPVRDETRAVTGVLAIVVETTTRVLSQRRLRTLQAVTAASTGTASVHVAMQRGLALLAGSGGLEGTAQDVPFALGYLVDERTRRAQLVAAAGVEPASAMGPPTIDIRVGHPAWPLAAVMEAEGSTVLLGDLAERFRGARVGSGGDAPHAAMLLPLRVIAGDPPAGVLICGLNPRLPLDDTYRAFLDLLASRLSASLTEAQIRERERERMARLAEIDRAKTEFFNNVSHEFRTPLTLLLGPLEELTRQPEQIPKALTEDLQLAARNARRLLNQVDTLLDFSRAEARRLHATFEPTDLATLTRDIASVFRSAAERAGLTLRLDCPPLGEPVWVDPQMWERIVSNLLSNALKFTFAGEIAVELHARARHAELIVRDTGIGIPPEERAHVFTRFHRVPGRRGRTNDGSGIGLALVHELVRLHHGRVRVDGAEGQGSTFTIWIPMGRRPQQDGPETILETVADAAPRAAPIAAALADEAATWTTPSRSGDTPELFGPPMRPAPLEGATRGRVLIVDDNADMREYLERLLNQWEVTLAADVTSAIDAIGRARPDVIVADVMMPGADGFELLKWIRSDDTLRYTPVVLVTARAGEETVIEGLRAGADDYVAKPFSPRELVARIEAAVHRSRAEAAVREEFRNTQILRDLASRLVTTDNIQTIYEDVLSAAIEITRARAGSVQMLDDETQELVMLAIRGFSGRAAEYFHRVQAGSHTSCGLALRTGTRAYFDFDPASPEMSTRLHVEDGVLSAQSTPLVSRSGQAIGMVSTHWGDADHRPSERELRFLDLLARQAADLIERNRVERALRDSEERLRSLFATMSEGMAIMTLVRDEAGRVVDTRYLELNPAFERLTGFTRSAIEGRRTSEVFPLHFASFQPRLAAVTGPARPERFESFIPEMGRWFSFYAAPFGGPDGFVVFFDDITERKQREEQQAFLLRLSDALRTLADPEEVQFTAAAVLGRHLGATRVAYAEHLADGKRFRVFRNYVDSAPDMAGVHEYADYGADILSGLQSGTRRVQPDIARDETLTAGQRRAFADAGIGASLNVPLVKGGRLVAFLGVNYAAPHDFTAAEIGLVEEVAERAWAAVERARAESALRASELKYRSLLESIEQGFYIAEVIQDPAGKVIDFRHVEANAAIGRITGLDVLGKLVSDVVPGLEDHWLAPLEHVVRTGRPMRMENYSEAMNRWYQAYYTLVGGPGSRLVAVLVDDITERKRHEQR